MEQEKKKLNVEEAFRNFGSSEKGLSDKDVTKNQQTYGYNEIPEKKVSPVLKFLRYMWGPIPWIRLHGMALF